LEIKTEVVGIAPTSGCTFAMAGKNAVTLWTVQPLETWKKLQKALVLRVEPERIDLDFLPAYDWLRNELSLRIDGYSGGYPWWAYYRPWPRQRRKRGIEQMCLQLAVPRERVAFHNSSAWLMVMGRFYVALDDEEDRRITKRGEVAGYPLPADLAADIEASWSRVFDVEALGRSDVLKLGDIHANFEELRLEDVVEAKRGQW
jgi:hypothetical protein